MTLKVLNYGIDDEKQSIKKIEKNGNRKSPAKSPFRKRAAQMRAGRFFLSNPRLES
nr:MAG TPA: hypothetical protein [Caudoviricetes sp.]